VIDDELEQPQAGAEGYDPSAAPAPDYETGGASPMGDTGDEPGAPDDTEALLAALAYAEPAWLKDPQPNAEGYQPPQFNPSESSGPSFAGNKTDYPAPFPEAVTEDVTEQTPQDLGPQPEYSFELEFDKINKDGTVSIIINYGEINFAPPDDMSPDEVFTFDLDTSDEEIWVQVVYDTTTLEITGRTLEYGPTLPDSTLGTLIVPIGYVTWDTDSKGNKTNISVHNRQCGDIKVAFLYGALNGAEALFSLRMYDDGLAVPPP
jgi:hypothetical protein